MPKRSSKTREQEDVDDPNVTAFNVIQEATSRDDAPPEKNPAAVALGGSQWFRVA